MVNSATQSGGDGTRRPAGEGGRVSQEERDDSRWYPVYLAVIVTTALVIAALWAFSRAYSS